MELMSQTASPRLHEEPKAQRLSLGDFELTILSDGHYYLDGGAMFGVVPKPLWEKRLPADEQNRVELGLNTLVIRTGDKTVLVETGIGAKMSEKSATIYDNQMLLMRHLEAAKIAPDEVDIVINTHLHFDHCGWNTRRRTDGTMVPTFPRARYYFQRAQLEHAHRQHERDRVSYMTDNYDPMVRNGQAVLLEGDAPIVRGVEVRVTPGHTPGHQSVIVRSGGKTTCYFGDLLPTTAHVQPTWVIGYDLLPLESIESRHRLYEDAIPERWLCIFTHDYRTPAAYITRSDGKYGVEKIG